MAKKLKLIKGLSDSPLKKLNEGQVLKNPDKYVFEGVFTQCSTPDHKVINRNGRIYQSGEVLRHLGYLRDMIKENGGRILGELDHPEGRFEVSMKEASHMITDLWYDQNTNCVMGRLEVLDTPNGKTLKSLIDAGYPLYVSSRAAGDVDPKTKEVEIAQIFTYDVVCTPGFKEARLERVNESLLTDGALKYINESAGGENKEIKNDEVEIPMEAINENINNFKDIKIEDVVKPLNEDEESKDDEKPLNDDVKKFLPIMNMGTQPAPSNSTEKKDELKEEGGEDEASEEDKNKENLENSDENNNENNSEENQEEVGDEEEKKELTDEEKEANREKIVSVKGMDADGNVLGGETEESDKSDDIENIEAETKDSDEEENKDENSEENSEDEEETSENGDVNKETKKAEEKTSELKKKTDDDVAELESILASVKKKEEVKESIINRYPFAAALTEGNFAKFAALRPKQKKRVLDFINEHEIYDIQSINELWKTPLTEEKQVQQNWLKLASQSDIDLYVAAPMEVQNAIEEQAKYFPMETEADVDAFWNMTGLRQQAMRKAMNEQMINDYNSFIANVDESVEANLGYDPYLIRQTELWLQNDEF